MLAVILADFMHTRHVLMLYCRPSSQMECSFQASSPRSPQLALWLIPCTIYGFAFPEHRSGRVGGVWATGSRGIFVMCERFKFGVPQCRWSTANIQNKKGDESRAIQCLEHHRTDVLPCRTSSPLPASIRRPTCHETKTSGKMREHSAQNQKKMKKYVPCDNAGRPESILGNSTNDVGQPHNTS